jgi:hypothetical protein
MPATLESNVGNADAVTNSFNFLNGFNQPEPNAAGGAQNPGLYALLTADTQLENNMGGADRNLNTDVVDGISTATAQVELYGCRMMCISGLLSECIPVCILIPRKKIEWNDIIRDKFWMSG